MVYSIIHYFCFWQVTIEVNGIGSPGQPYYRFMGSAIWKDNNVGYYSQYGTNPTCKVSKWNLRVKDKWHWTTTIFPIFLSYVYIWYFTV